MKEAETAAKKDIAPKDRIRESFHMLQPSATDKENLVAAGRILRSTKHMKKTENVTSEKTRCNPPNKTNVISKKTTSIEKAIQTSAKEMIKTEIEDLTSTAGPSENYWEVLAERRQKAIDNALKENRILKDHVDKLKDHIEKLKEQNETLKEEKRVYQEMLSETRALVEVLQEMVEGDGNGINNSLEDSTC